VLWELKEAAKWEDMGIMGSLVITVLLLSARQEAAKEEFKPHLAAQSFALQSCRRCKDRKVLPIMVVAFSFSSYIRSHVAK